MGIRTAIAHFLFGDLIREHYARFVAPHVERLTAMGVSEQEAERLYRCAVKHAEPTIVGLAPGSLFRDMVDRVEAGETVDQVIATFN